MSMDEQGSILVVDDLPQNVRLLEAILAPRGYRVSAATSGPEALATVAAESIDLVLLDILMPAMDGYAVCRALRVEPSTSFLPVVMITASGEQEKVAAIEAGADDFIAKPFDQAELLARVKSLLRIKRYHDTIETQAAELAAWNRELEQRVAEQVEALERMARLRRFLSPQLAELVLSSGLVPAEPPPRDHRRVLRPARLHELRRDGRARGRHGGAERIPRRAGGHRLSLRRDARAVYR
jgi:DNA-binding response OmpR family regulator